MNKPLPDYSDPLYEHRPKPGSLMDWVQTHSMQRVGFWLMVIGLLPVVIYLMVTDSPTSGEDIHILFYFLVSWWFALSGGAFILYALKGIAPGVVTIYGVWAKVINAFLAVMFLVFALLSLYLGLWHVIASAQ